MAADAPTDVVDDVRAAAQGTRRTAAWIASALGAIPGLALLTTVVQAPGEEGYDGSLLLAGALLATLGGVAALWLFSWVLTPVALKDSSLAGFDVSGIPGSRFSDYEELTESLATARDGVRRSEGPATIAEARAKHDQAAAVEAERHTAAFAKDAGDDARSKARLERLRDDADAKSSRAGESAADAAVAKATLDLFRDQLSRNVALRSEAFLWKAADVVRERFGRALLYTPLTIGAVVFGLVLIAFAPNEKAEAPAPAAGPSVVVLRLTPEGAAAAGCRKGTNRVSALRIAGTDERPTVITLVSESCPRSRFLEFTQSNPALGRTAPAQPVAPLGRP